ncbi:hypothetical protein N507_2494 [Lacticaseibacillus rhamnosus DSM 14870]|nr:hypothetical protein N507_2494 [Lacticaseibacillus rhamnosus DSM 14870]
MTIRIYKINDVMNPSGHQYFGGLFVAMPKCPSMGGPKKERIE